MQRGRLQTYHLHLVFGQALMENTKPDFLLMAASAQNLLRQFTQEWFLSETSHHILG